MLWSQAGALLRAPPPLRLRSPSRFLPLSLHPPALQYPHADGLVAPLDNFADAHSARRAAGEPVDPAWPFTALMALSQPATLLVSPYTSEEDRLLGQDEAKDRKYPAKKLPMKRVAIPRFHVFVFGQQKIHGGDSCRRGPHVRMHVFYDHKRVAVKADTTSLVSKAVASYYKAPA